MAMRLSQWLWLVLLLAVPCGLLMAAEEPTVLYVQLIQGTNEEKAPEPKAKPIGPKLSERLTPVFRWKYYWQMSDHEVKVSRGNVSKLGLKVRDLEIQLHPDGNLELRLFQNGKLVRTSRQKLQPDTMEIMGGSTENKDNAWFVVVRRDKPQ